MFTKSGEKRLLPVLGSNIHGLNNVFARVKLFGSKQCFKKRFETVKVLKVVNPDNTDTLGYLLI